MSAERSLISRRRSQSPCAARLGRAGVDATHLSDEQIEASFTRFHAGEPTWTSLEHERLAIECWADELLDSMPLPPRLRELAITELWRYEELFRCVPGILQLLGKLRELGIRQAVVSNWAPSLPRILQHHQLTDFFEALIYSTQDGIHKPDERIYRRALAALDVAPENALFIGDTFDCDVEGPRRVGMARSILIRAVNIPSLTPVPSMPLVNA